MLPKRLGSDKSLNDELVSLHQKPFKNKVTQFYVVPDIFVVLNFTAKRCRIARSQIN